MLVLSMAGSGAGLEELDREASLIRRLLERGASVVDFRVEEARVDRAADLITLLDEHDPLIVHLVGRDGELSLEHRAPSPEQLAALLARADASIECVLLNTHFSLERADALLDRVRCVVGSPGGAGDAAGGFWTGFYQGLARGDGYAAAFERGRAAVAALGPASDETPRFATRDLEILDPERACPRSATEPTRHAFKGIGEPGAEAPLYPLWFGTNRAPVDANDPTRGFSGERDTELHYGTCQVAVPRSHRIGSIGSSWWKRLLTREDDRLRLDWEAFRLLAADAFWADLSRALAERDVGQRMGLVVIHGYNVSFEAAALRAAQIGFDLQVPGATAFFSWPSRARLARYTADEATIQASEKHIARFLLEFTRRSGAEQVHIIAHSMGNRGLLRGVGFTPPVTVVPDIDTVEVTNVDVSLLGHGYFAEARDLLHDIHSVLVQDAPPDRRMGLRPAATADGRPWRESA